VGRTLNQALSSSTSSLERRSEFTLFTAVDVFNVATPHLGKCTIAAGHRCQG